MTSGPLGKEIDRLENKATYNEFAGGVMLLNFYFRI